MPTLCLSLARVAAATLLAASALRPAAAADGDAEAPWSVSLRSDHHSDAVALRHLDDDRAALDHLATHRGRQLAYVEDEARASRRAGALTWSLLARNSATLVTDDDTLDLVRQVAGRGLPGRDRHWDVAARLKGFAGAGLEAAWSARPARGWQAELAVQALSLRRWRERDIDGQVDFDAARGGYAFDLRSTETSERLTFPFEQPHAARGIGLLLSGTLGWQAAPGRGVTLTLRDLGWLRWRGIPQEEARLSTFTRDVDADGFVVFKPLLEGRNSQAGRRVRLAPKATLRGQWSDGGWGRLEAAVDTVPGFGALPSFGWQRPFGAVEVGLGWRVHERRTTLTLGWRGWQLRLGADRLGREARSRDVGLSGAFAF